MGDENLVAPGAVVPETPASPVVQPTEPAAPASGETVPDAGSAEYLSRSEAEAVIAERERHFQSVADRRIAEERRKMQQEFESKYGAAAQPAAVSPQPQAQMQQAMDAGFTQAEVVKAIDDGTFPQLMTKIADATIERRLQERENRERADRAVAQFGNEVDRMVKQYGLSPAEVQRIADVTDRFINERGYLPNPVEAVYAATGVNQEQMLAAALNARKTPPAAPVRTAPPIVGGDGSNIPNAAPTPSAYQSGTVGSLWKKG